MSGMAARRPNQVEETPVATKPPATPASTFTWAISSTIGSQIHNQLFPGNTPNAIRYEYLDKKYGGLLDRLPQRHEVIESKVGSKVGLHIYQPHENTKLVVILCHGNTRPSRYLPELVQSFVNCDVTVVCRDFVGYDTSSRVPNVNGALEIASIANDAAVVDWVAMQYPQADLVACGRSIGTFGWANMLPHERVVAALVIVPFTSAEAVVKNLIGNILPWPLSLLASWGQYLAHSAFPSGFASEDGQIVSRSFTIGEFGPDVKSKRVVLFPACRDDLVPESEAEDLKRLLEQADVRVDIEQLEGGHHALPSQEALKSALDLFRTQPT